VTAAADGPIRIDGVTIPGSGVEGQASLWLEGGRITAITPAGAASPSAGAAPSTDSGAPARRFDGSGFSASPGFIDLQINGAAGRDLTTEPEALWEVGAALPRYGVTAFLPTLVSASSAVIDRARAAFLAGPPADYRGATPLGWHIEGPFLSPKRAGAHDPASLRAPDPAAIEGWNPAAGVRIVTLAPELPGALDIVRALVDQGVVVSAGHSAATDAQARAGFDAGIRSVTHLFNAMGPLDHREPGLAGAALVDARITVGLIPDGLHVHPTLVAIVRQAVGADRLAIVTDAIAALGMEPGDHHLAGRRVRVHGGSARLEDGTLAGSVISLDDGLRNLASFCGIGVAAALPAVTTVPARLLGLAGERGVLEPGAVADVTLLTPDGRVVLTIAAGRIAHDATEEARWA
jgi:N-acetylglucosamine-6-phosphate deacetylase